MRTNDVVYLDKLTGQGVPQFLDSGVGLVAPAHSTALGQVLLAIRSELSSEAVAVKHGLPRCTGSTITSLRRLQGELTEVGRRGGRTTIMRRFKESHVSLCRFGTPAERCKRR
jgi:DNA-binding IclR family transcriptional regulator